VFESKNAHHVAQTTDHQLNDEFVAAGVISVYVQRRAVLALLVLPMLALWLPTASLLVAVTFIASMGVGFVMAFNATYIAAFYWPGNLYTNYPRHIHFPV
jgi:hypothetical protein